jgi:hypothetical protein
METDKDKLVRLTRELAEAKANKKRDNKHHSDIIRDIEDDIKQLMAFIEESDEINSE